MTQQNRNAPYICEVCGKPWPGDWYDGPCCPPSPPEEQQPSFDRASAMAYAKRMGLPTKFPL